jgi:Ni/Fe-hydrogenase subunit HybB-like protein
MFAFSIFWTYLWFDQYMLIWYANIPEETTYFKIRVEGPFRGIFFVNLILNFACPLLILMKKAVKRNWTMVTFMAILIIFGHWLDFWQMVMPGTLKDHAELMPFEFGIAALFIGIIMWRVGVYLSSHPMLMKNHPFLKESMIHHT